MSAYRLMDRATQLRRQAKARFGDDSSEFKRAKDVEQYWKEQWVTEGSYIHAPDAYTLRAAIARAETSVEEHRKFTKKGA